MALVPKHIKNLLPYIAGKPIDEVKRELGLSDIIKLASNENPLGPSKLSLDALVATQCNFANFVIAYLISLSRAPKVLSPP